MSYYIGSQHNKRSLAIMITDYRSSVEETTLANQPIEPRPSSSRLTMPFPNLPRNFYNQALLTVRCVTYAILFYLCWNSLMELLRQSNLQSFPGIPEPPDTPPCPPCFWKATPSLACHPCWRQSMIMDYHLAPLRCNYPIWLCNQWGTACTYVI